MRVRRVEILRSAGISPGFTVDGFGDGLTIIEGRNESGKSTLARAIGALLWPAGSADLHARGVFVVQGVEHRAYVDAHGGGWEGPPPVLPDQSAGRGMILGIADLWQEGDHDKAIREAMTREIQGGYDLEPLRMAARGTSPTGPMRAMREAEGGLRRARQSAEALMVQEAGLPALHEQAEALRLRASRQAVVQKAIERLDRLEAREAKAHELATMPKGALRVRGDEDRRLNELQAEIEAARERIETESRAAQDAGRAIELLGLPETGVDRADLMLLDQLASEAGAIERQRADARREAERARAQTHAIGGTTRAADPETLDRLDAALARVQEARERRARDVAAAEQPAPEATAPRSRLLPIVTAVVAGLTAIASAIALVWVVLAWAALVFAIATLLLAVATLSQRRPANGGDASAHARQRAEHSERAYREVLSDFHAIAGVDDELESTLSIVTAARRTKQHDEALLELHARQADAESLDEQLAGVLARAVGVLARYMPEACESTDELSRLRAGLARRADEHERLTERLSNANARVAEGQRQFDRATRQRRELLDGLGLNDANAEELHEWLRLRERAHRLRDGLRADDAVLFTLEDALADSPALRDEDRAGLEAMLADCDRAEGEAAWLHQEIGKVRGDIERARQSADVQRALGACEAAAEAVARARDEECGKAARRLVLEHAAAGVLREDMPQLVRAADDLLARFTANAYGLRIDESNTPVVHDLRAGASKGYHQLSTGTRAQALLAMRLAATIEAERRAHAGPLPIILDEPLATTDDERFEAVASAMIGLAHEGRQLVYLTCEPAHAARLAHLVGQRELAVSRIDLDALRHRQNTRRVSADALLEPKPRLSPEDLPREAYLDHRGVTPLDPWKSPHAIDLYHVLPDDLQTLHTLSLHGLTTVGQLLDQQSRLGDKFAWPSVARHARIAQRLVLAWRVGRSRPLTTADLVDSGAFGPAYLDGVIAMNDELGGSARDLLHALGAREDERAKGFQRKKLEQFQSYLSDRGLLPSGEVLEPAEIIERALANEVIGMKDDPADLALVRYVIGYLGAHTSHPIDA